MTTITTDDGVKLNVRLDGDPGKPSVLLSNSLGTDLGMWDGQIEILTRHFQVIRYDPRGHGESEGPDGDYTISRLGRDAVCVLKGIGIERAAVCGVSMGGMIGMWLGAHAPERVTRLALCNTAAKLGPPDMWQTRIGTVRSHGMAAIADQVVARWFTEPFQARAPETVDRIRAMLLSTSPAGYTGCCAAIRDMDQTRDLRRISAPVLVVAGADDPATPPEQGEAIAAAVSGAELDVFPECAHLSNIEQEARFNDRVPAFLADL
ncbi:3-oxoadipate enol-lactonase [Amorphus orientalis]|uniref:3-oxoadipate enol-lactonase n=1 Tax=Amorphus orientalis TaxID=649198 RepID=A0AAE4AS13_9HYPH|nr:3-oxoadipate enol-lactonase [Amorphus orientalis]MDQ0315716.1 3-oxoadipate enol-lactonase [Amorphus orientalis]